MTTDGEKSGGVSGQLRTLSKVEKIIGAGCLILLVSMPLTWKDYHGFGAVNGLNGWGFATLLILLGTIALLAARSPFFRNTVTVGLPVADGIAYTIAGAAELVTILLFSSQYASGRTAGLGFYLAVLGALLTLGGGVLALRSTRDAPAAPEPPPADPPELRGGGLPTAPGDQPGE